MLTNRMFDEMNRLLTAVAMFTAPAVAGPLADEPVGGR